MTKPDAFDLHQLLFVALPTKWPMAFTELSPEVKQLLEDLAEVISDYGESND